MPLDVASGKPILKPRDYDLWLECRNCGSLYQKHETRIEAEIGYIKEAMTGPKGKVQKVEKKPKQRIRRGNNPRVEGNKWELKDSELNAELRSGSVLLSYSEVQPIQ
jgi:uncharacterized Zn finger protein